MTPTAPAATGSARPRHLGALTAATALLATLVALSVPAGLGAVRGSLRGPGRAARRCHQRVRAALGHRRRPAGRAFGDRGLLGAVPRRQGDAVDGSSRRALHPAREGVASEHGSRQPCSAMGPRGARPRSQRPGGGLAAGSRRQPPGCRDSAVIGAGGPVFADQVARWNRSWSRRGRWSEAVPRRLRRRCCGRLRALPRDHGSAGNRCDLGSDRGCGGAVAPTHPHGADPAIVAPGARRGRRGLLLLAGAFALVTAANISTALHPSAALVGFLAGGA